MCSVCEILYRRHKKFITDEKKLSKNVLYLSTIIVACFFIFALIFGESVKTVIYEENGMNYEIQICEINNLRYIYAGVTVGNMSNM